MDLKSTLRQTLSEEAAYLHTVFKTQYCNIVNNGSSN